MNRWWWPAGAAAAVIGCLAATTMAGPVPVPVPQVSAPSSRVSVVCPVATSATAELRVAATTAGAELRTAKVSAPNKTTSSDKLVVLNQPAEPVRISAQQSAPFGATAVVTAADGPERGLSAALCSAPQTEHWFAGIDAGADTQAEVVLVNLDASAAAVDLTAYAETGRVAAPRGVNVAGNATTRVSLAALAATKAPLTLRVSSSEGRVAAFVRQRVWSGDHPLGADWLPATSAPAPEQVLSGIPAGEGRRSLVVSNPGDRAASIAVGVLGTSGLIELAGVEQLEVSAESTRVVDLGPGLDGQAAGLKLTASQPVVAGVIADSGGADTRRDPAYLAATAPLAADGIWPLAAGKSATTVLQLANPGQADAVVSVMVGNDAAKELKVPAGSTLTFDLAAASVSVLRLHTTATDLRAALISNRQLSRVQGLTVIGLSSEEPPPGTADVVHDPHTGT